MDYWFKRRTPPGPRPCLASEVLQQVLLGEKSAHMILTSAEAQELSAPTRLTSNEWLGFHAVSFLIVVWNLFAIDLAHTPDRWWFWIPTVVLAGALMIHAAWLAPRGGKALAMKIRAALTRGAAAR
jgi:hypothetical protein